MQKLFVCAIKVKVIHDLYAHLEKGQTTAGIFVICIIFRYILYVYFLKDVLLIEINFKVLQIKLQILASLIWSRDI